LLAAQPVSKIAVENRTMPSFFMVTPLFSLLDRDYFL